MFVSEAEEAGHDPEELRAQHEQWRRAAHADTRWAHFVNIALGCWILVPPVIVEVQEPALFWSAIVLGAALILFATLSLSLRMARSEERRVGKEGVCTLRSRWSQYH